MFQVLGYLGDNCFIWDRFTIYGMKIKWLLQLLYLPKLLPIPISTTKAADHILHTKYLDQHW